MKYALKLLIEQISGLGDRIDTPVIVIYGDRLRHFFIGKVIPAELSEEAGAFIVVFGDAGCELYRPGHRTDGTRGVSGHSKGPREAPPGIRGIAGINRLLKKNDALLKIALIDEVLRLAVKIFFVKLFRIGHIISRPHILPRFPRDCQRRPPGNILKIGNRSFRMTSMPSRPAPNVFRWIVITVAFGAFMSKLDSYIVNISLPTIAERFHVTSAEVSWVVLVYLLVSTSTLLLFGKLGDRFGLRRVFFFGYLLFTLGSLLCGGATSLEMLVSARFIQGIGCAMILAIAFAVIPRFLPPEKTGWAFGIASTGAALGIAIGAPAGGIITGLLSWRWVFFVNVPFGIFAMYAVNRYIPDEELIHPRKPGTASFDILGAALSFGGLASFIYALNTGWDFGWTSVRILGSFALCLVFLAIFFVREVKCAEPLLELSLFKSFHFTAAVTSTLFAYMLLSGTSFLLPFYLETGKKLPTQTVGFIIMIYSVIYMATGPYAGRISDKMRPSTLCAFAMLSAAACSFFFAFTLDMPGLVPVVIFLIWIAFSFGFFISPNNNQVMRLAPAHKQGSASGVFNTINSLGLALGVCIFESLMSRTSTGRGLNIVHSATMAGYRNAYIFGGIVCIIALFFSLLIGWNSKSGDKA
jgi:EmrB/QacA subfamily drug resistance transporter